MASVTSESAYRDAQSQNDISRNMRQYRDLDLFFAKKQGSDDISKITDIEAVKRSVKNLILTNRYERPFHPEIGSSVIGLLFEPVSPTTSVVLKQRILEVIENYEPRAIVNDIEIFGDIDRNGYEITIIFTPLNSLEPVQIDLFLERLR